MRLCLIFKYLITNNRASKAILLSGHLFGAGVPKLVQIRHIALSPEPVLKPSHYPAAAGWPSAKTERTVPTPRSRPRRFDPTAQAVALLDLSAC